MQAKARARSPQTAPASAYTLRSTALPRSIRKSARFLGEDDAEATSAPRASVDESFLYEIEKELEGE
jgi:hypothetical protein